MSATMDQEPSEAAGQSPPPLLGHTATGNPPSWSTLPFTGSPNMAFAVYSPAGITSAGIASAGLPPPLQLATTGTKCTTSYLSPAPLLEDFLAHYEQHAFTTDLLMIGHLPLNLSHREFCDTMDVIQRQFSISTINNFYSTAEFGLRFQPSAGASWANDGFTYPSEQHCTYFFRLARALPFAYTGQLDEELRANWTSVPPFSAHRGTVPDRQPLAFTTRLSGVLWPTFTGGDLRCTMARSGKRTAQVFEAGVQMGKSMGRKSRPRLGRKMGLYRCLGTHNYKRVCTPRWFQMTQNTGWSFLNAFTSPNFGMAMEFALDKVCIQVDTSTLQSLSNSSNDLTGLYGLSGARGSLTRPPCSLPNERLGQGRIPGYPRPHGLTAHLMGGPSSPPPRRSALLVDLYGCQLAGGSPHPSAGCFWSSRHSCRSGCAFLFFGKTVI